MVVKAEHAGSALGLPRAHTQPETGEAQHDRLLRFAPAQQGVYLRQQHLPGEGLDDVIIGIQPAHLRGWGTLAVTRRAVSLSTCLQRGVAGAAPPRPSL